MSRNIKYLGSNCKPVTTETVESKQTNQLNSSKEIKMENVQTAAIELNTTVEAVETAQPETIEVTAPTNNQPVEEKDMNIETKEDKLKEAAQIASEVRTRNVNWHAVSASAVIAGVAVGSRLIVENKTTEENHSALEIVGRVAAVSTVAAGMSFVTQKLAPSIANNDSYNLMTTATIANGLSVADAFFGDDLVAMMNGAGAKVTETVTEMFNKEEAAELEA
ncbi:hypothetical protein N1M2_104 [Klebsiella phage N1M2]|uniref:Uncharacterized protein n=1 Tax=Klebsiella phage N1M2 TaxID=2664939 RepID=A0A6B7ZEQ2_9CAUD|nr:hypothetical protein PQB72_gp104 [Klebsiella phage N1M2]QGH71967.1 hypothetical protein N1M2_104 [Klebsiella phage N1M2]